MTRSCFRRRSGGSKREKHRKKYEPLLSGGSTALDESLPAVTMVWQYLGQLMFNMLVLTGLVKGSDRLVHEMLGA